MTHEQLIFRSPIQEIGLNKGLAYRESTEQWYPVTRVAAIMPWTLCTTGERELATPFHFSTQDGAIAYLVENKGLTQPYIDRFLREQAEKHS